MEPIDKLQIRKAKNEDLNTILKIYEFAREFMRQNNNPSQWGSSHPVKEILINDIKEGLLYVVTSNNIIHGVFAFIIGEDPTYINIENGKWLSSNTYGTIHRIASDGKIKGIFHFVVNYCYSIIPHIRIDTHEDNKIMQHLVNKEGFSYRGIIYVSDGTSRLAYEKI